MVDGLKMTSTIVDGLKMTSTIVDGLKTFIGTNCLNRVQDMENRYKTMKDNNAFLKISQRI